MSCPKKLYRIDIINNYINQMNHINNFNKYKNELKRSFECQNICENCQDNICSMDSHYIHNEYDDSDRHFCDECIDIVFVCMSCDNYGVDNDYLIEFDGPYIELCYECNMELCDSCHSNCSECGVMCCIDCLNDEYICPRCDDE
jgi:hypothetical protein